MSNPISSPTEGAGTVTHLKPTEAIREARKALYCLYLAVEPSIVRDVSGAVENAFAALWAELAALRSTENTAARPVAEPSERRSVFTCAICGTTTYLPHDCPAFRRPVAEAGGELEGLLDELERAVVNDWQADAGQYRDIRAAARSAVVAHHERALHARKGWQKVWATERQNVVRLRSEVERLTGELKRMRESSFSTDILRSTPSATTESESLEDKVYRLLDPKAR